MEAKTVDEYVESLEGWQQEVVKTLRDLILKTVPDAKESFKWSQPVYEVNGPFCHIKAFSKHVNFGFWRGGELDDPLGLLQGMGDKMRHVGLTGVKDIRKKAFQDFLRAAADLNRAKGDPTSSPER